MFASVSPSGVKLPVGLHFRPTDEKILEYLYHKIHGLQYHENQVFDFDLYGDIEPWVIWAGHKLVDDDEDLYFFTKLKRSTIKNSAQLSAHIDRKIGLAGGTWSGENSANPIFHMKGDTETLGYRKRFRYENPNLPEHHGEWIMHEYTVHENLLREGAINPDYVLCRMRKNERPIRKAKKLCLRQPVMNNNNNNKILAPMRSQMRINETYGRNISELQPATTYQEVIAPEMATTQFSNYYDINNGTNDINNGTNDINKVTNDISHMPEMMMNTNIQGSSEVSNEATVEDDIDFAMELEELLENDLQAAEDDISHMPGMMMNTNIQGSSEVVDEATVEDDTDFAMALEELLENDLQAAEDDIDFVVELEELLDNDLQATDQSQI